MTWLFVGIWGFFWAIARFYVTKLGALLFGSHFPYGTLLANLIGSFIIWCLFALFENVVVDPKYKSMITTGFLWALTTFSTFALESFFMIDRWNYFHFVLNISLNLIGTILFAWIGFYLVNYLFKNTTWNWL